MIGRLVYLVAGAAIGGYLVHKISRTARAWSPGGIAGRVEGRVADYRTALREFNEDVQDAVNRREAELLRHHCPDERRVFDRPGVARGPAEDTHGIIEAHDMKDGR